MGRKIFQGKFQKPVDKRVLPCYTVFEVKDKAVPEEDMEMKVARALEMALALSKNYTWDAYNALIDYCDANEISFFHDEEEGKIYIEDDWFSIV